MKVFATALLVASGAAFAAAAATSSTAAQLVTAVNKLDTDLKTLNATVAEFNGGLNLLAAADIIKDENTVSQDISAATKIINAHKGDYDDDTEVPQLIGPLLNLVPDVVSTIQEIEAKKPVFEAFLLGVGAQIVLSDLKSLNSSTGTFVSALEAHLDSTYAPLVGIESASIFTEFNKAIAEYSASSGLL